MNILKCLNIEKSPFFFKWLKILDVVNVLNEPLFSSHFVNIKKKKKFFYYPEGFFLEKNKNKNILNQYT